MTTPQPDAAATLHRLEAFRLDKVWSYQRLAHEIETVVGAAIDQSTLNKAVAAGRASRLTLHVLDKFLQAVVGSESAS